MIRFCDKEEYVVQLGEMTRSQMLMFFLKEEGKHRLDIITILDGEEYYGIVTYERVLKYKDEDKVINRDVIRITNHFWEEAREYFADNPRELLPVADLEGNVLGFAYNDDDMKYVELTECISTFEKEKALPVSFFDWQEDCRLICIFDVNELAYRCYKLFLEMGYVVCVLGEKWSWFGIEQLEGFYEYPEYEKFYIYAEGTMWNRNKNIHEDSSMAIKGNFSFFFEWANANMEQVYNEKIEYFVDKNVSVCRCIVPEIKEISVFTQDENISAQLHTDAYVYLENKNAYSQKAKSNLKDIIGVEEFEALEKDKLIYGDDWENIDFNQLPAQKLKQVDGRNRVYIIGPCLVRIGVCFTKDNLSAQLQEKVLQDEYMVVTLSYSRFSFGLLKNAIENLPIRDNDILLFLDSRERLKNIQDGSVVVDLIDDYNNPNRHTWIMNKYPLHINKQGHSVIAKKIYDEYLQNVIKRDSSQKIQFVQVGNVLNDELQEDIRRYVDSIRMEKAEVKKTGAIVMNCNPFTLGHQYLIEYAAAKVDLLYIFVVEENKSEFDFKDRIEMVERGTAHLNNVAVVPSGNWVLSYHTMPIYFEKSVRKEEKVNAELDLQIFARYIAPQLDISIRFVGEEPIDKITRQYNEQMKLILAEFNIEVEEIARKQCGDKVISASAVRGYMQEKNWDMVKQYVPETTYQFIKGKE